MVPKLYMTICSAPVRAVLLCVNALNLELDEIEVDLLKYKNLSEEYLKLNPLHTVPTLVDDDGFVLSDSHAIMGYLVEKYGKDKSLYPSDSKKRALINQILHFDSGTLFPRGLVISKNIIFKGIKEIPPTNAAAVIESYGFLEKFLEKNKWVAGDEMSIADFSIVTTITNWNVLVPIEESKHPKIMSWLKQMEALPYYNEVQRGIGMYKTLIESKLSQ